MYLLFPTLDLFATTVVRKYEIRYQWRFIGLHCNVADFTGLDFFLMAQVKQSWQYWNYCIEESL